MKIYSLKGYKLNPLSYVIWLTTPITFQLFSARSCGSEDSSHINEDVENCKISYSLEVYLIYKRIGTFLNF